MFNSPANLVDPSGEAGRIPPFAKKCIVGLIKAIAKIAGTDLSKRKSDITPENVLDAAQGCVGVGNKPKGAGGTGKSGNNVGQNTSQSGGGTTSNSNVRNSKEKEALVDMAQSDRRKGISQADIEAYKELNKGLPDPFPPGKVRADPGHSGGLPSSRVPHGHVGPVDHIPILSDK